MHWLIILAVLCMLAFLPLGFRAIYRDKKSGVWLLIGPIRISVYPGKRRKKEEKKQSDKRKKSNETSQKNGRNYKDFLPIIRTILEFLSHFRRKIRIKRLELKVILAGDDPSDLAVNYGRAWAALGNLMPQLERLFVIKKRDLEVECDFTGEETLIYARIDATISVAKTLHLLTRHGIRTLNQLIKLKNLRKGGAKL